MRGPKCTSMVHGFVSMTIIISRKVFGLMPMTIVISCQVFISLNRVSAGARRVRRGCGGSGGGTTMHNNYCTAIITISNDSCVRLLNGADVIFF